jgi:polar amino acid transport system substrate-binding protein
MLVRLLLCLLSSLVLPKAKAEPFMIYGPHDGHPKYFEEDGEAKGIVVDISRHCLDEMKVPYRIRLIPWARAYRQAERAEGAVIGLSVSQERLELFDFSEPIFTERVMLLVKMGRKFPYERIEDLKGRLIGVTNGTSYGTAYDEAVANGTLTIVGFNSTQSGLAMLNRERVDAILIGSSVNVGGLVERSEDLRGSVFTTLPLPFKTDSKHMGIAKSLKMGWFLDSFNQCLERGHAAGTFESFVYRYTN